MFQMLFWSQKISFLYPIFILELRLNRQFLKPVKQVILCIHTHARICMNCRNSCVLTHDFIKFKFQRNKVCLLAEVRLQPYLTQREFVEILRDLRLLPQGSQAGGFVTGLYTTVLPSISLSVSKSYVHILQCELCYEITGKQVKRKTVCRFVLEKQFHPVENIS